MMMATRSVNVPCADPDCDHVTFVRIYGPTREEPGYESTDCCEECGETLDWPEAEDIDEFDHPDL